MNREIEQNLPHILCVISDTSFHTIPPHIPLRFGSTVAAARAPAGSTADASMPATAALAVWITSRRVPSKPDDRGEVAMLSGTFEDAASTGCRPRDTAALVKASPTAKAQSASNAWKAWDRISAEGSIYI